MKHSFKAVIVVALALATIGCNSNNTPMENNNVTDVIMARRSVRHYQDTPVSRDTLMQLAKLGINAPNAMNRQDWAIRIVDSEEFLNGVTELMKAGMPFPGSNDDPKFRNAFRNATAVIFVASPADDPSDMLAVNVGLLSENICLAAQSMGLGTVVMGGPLMFLSSNPDAKPFIDRLDLPEGYKLTICIGVGYPDEAPEAKPRDESKIKFVD